MLKISFLKKEDILEPIELYQWKSVKNGWLDDSLPKYVPFEPGERDMARKQTVALRHAESRPALWQFFWITLMECGWKYRLALI